MFMLDMATAHDAAESFKSSPWLSDTRATLLETPAWQRLAKSVYQNIQLKLEANHVQFFSELSADEKTMLIDEIEDSLEDDPVYTGFQELLSSTLDHSISNAVERDLRAPNNRLTKVQIIVQKASIGTTELLRGIPGEKKTLQLLLNQGLPGPLRSEVWKMYLVNRKERSTYEKRAANRRVNTISNIDADITQRCQTLLDTRFEELGESRSVLMTMKTVLSYYHVSTGSLEDSLYFLSIPLVLVYGDDFAHLSAVVEALFALLEVTRPRFPLLTADPAELVQRSKLVRRVVALLHEARPGLYQAMYDVCAASSADNVLGGAEVVNSDKVNMTLAQLVQPSVEQLFVGVLSIEATLYAWDQCLLGGFDRIVVPLAVCIVVLLERPLLKCETPQALVRTVTLKARTLTVGALQKAMELRFMPQLRAQLGVPLRGMSRWATSLREVGIEETGSEDQIDFGDSLDDFALADDENDVSESTREGKTRSVEDVKADVSRRLEIQLEIERKASEAEARARPQLRSSRRHQKTALFAINDSDNNKGDIEKIVVHSGASNTAEEGKEPEIKRVLGSGTGGTLKASADNNRDVVVLWNGTEFDLIVPTLDLAVDRLEDTALRVVDLNAKLLYGSEKLDKSQTLELRNAVKEAIKVARPELRQGRGAVLKILVKDNLGVPSRCYFRTLEDGETQEFAETIVKIQLERKSLPMNKLSKIAAQLVKKSVAAGWENPGLDKMLTTETVTQSNTVPSTLVSAEEDGLTKQQRKVAKTRKQRQGQSEEKKGGGGNDVNKLGLGTSDGIDSDAVLDIALVTMKALRRIAGPKHSTK